MKMSFAVASLISFGISLIFLVLITLFESFFAGVSTGVERLITFLLLVLPAVIGVGFRIMSLVRREARMGLAIAGLVLNFLFALFHLSLVLFAG